MSFQKTLKIPNKANLKIEPMNVTEVLTIDYNRMDTWYRGKNKANSNPICSCPAPKSLVLPERQLWIQKNQKIDARQ